MGKEKRGATGGAETAKKGKFFSVYNYCPPKNNILQTRTNLRRVERNGLKGAQEETSSWSQAATGRAAVGSPSLRSVPPLGPNRLARPQDRLHRVASGSGSGVEYKPLDSSGGWYANDKFEQATPERVECGNAERRGRQCTSRLDPAHLNKEEKNVATGPPDQGRTQSSIRRYSRTVWRTILVLCIPSWYNQMTMDHDHDR